jgi:roadblock/LC7 domain-containing protein
LQEASVNGVTSAFISDNDGRLVSFTGNYAESKALAAMVDNAMFVYNKYGNPLNSSSGNSSVAYSLLIDNENSKLAVVKADKFLVCFVGSKEIELGYLDKRATTFARKFAAGLKENDC